MILEIRRKSAPNLALLAVEIDDELYVRLIAHAVAAGTDVEAVVPNVLSAGCRALDTLSVADALHLLKVKP